MSAPPPRWRRVLRISVLTLTLSVLLLFGLWIFLKWWVVRLVNEQLVGHADWSDIRLSPGIIRISDVEVTDEKGQRVLTTPEVRISYSLGELWRTRSLLGALQEIVVESPRVEVTLHADGTFNLASVLRERPPSDSRDLYHGIVLLRQGEVRYKDEGRPFTATFSDLEGRIDLQTAEHGQGHLRFKQQTAEYRLEASWRRSFEDLRASFFIDDFDVAGWTDYYLSRVMSSLPPLARGRVSSGRGKARLLVSTRGPASSWKDTLNLSGTVWVEGLEGTLQRFPVPIRQGRMLAVITRDLLNIKRLTANVGGDSISASGRLFNLRSPQIDMAVTASSRDLAATLKRFQIKPSMPLRGSGQVDMQFLGAINGPPFVHLTLAAPLVGIAGRILRNVDGQLDWSNGMWHIQRLSARSEGGTVSLSGWVFGGDPPRVMLDVVTHDALLEELVGDVFGAGARASGTLTVLGTQARPLISGTGSMSGASVQGVSVSSASGRFVVQDKTVLFSDARASTAYGSFQSPFGFLDLGAHRQIYAHVTGQGMAYDGPQGSVRDAAVSLIVAGTPDHMYAAGKVSASHVGGGGVGVDDVHAFVAMSPDLLWLQQADFTVGGQRINAHGSVSPRDRAFEVTAWSRGVDPAALLASVGTRAPLSLGYGPFSLQAAGSPDDAAFHLVANSTSGRFEVNGLAQKGTVRGIAYGQGMNARTLSSLGLASLHPSGVVDVGALFALHPGTVDVDLVGVSDGLRVAGLPFDRVSFSGSSTGGLLQVREAALLGPVAMVAGHGRIGLAGGVPWDLSWDTDVQDLHRAEQALMVGVNPARLRKLLVEARLQSLRGHAFATGRITGSGRAPVVEGRALVDHARLHGEPLQVQTAFRYQDPDLTIRDGMVTLAGDPVRVSGTVGLSGDPRLELSVSTPHLDLMRGLAFTPYDTINAGGWIDGTVRLRGRVSALAADGKLHLHGGRIEEQRIDDAMVTLRAGAHSIIVQQLNARLGLGTVTGRGVLRVNGPISLDLQAHDFPLREVVALHDTPLAHGRGDFTVHVGGTAQHPQVAAQFDMNDFELTAVKDKVSLRGRMAWRAPRLELDGVTVTPGGSAGSATLSGYIDYAQKALPTTFDAFLAGDASLQVKLDHARLGTLYELAGRDSKDIGGVVDGTLALRGPLRKPTVDANVDGTQMRLGGVEVGTMHLNGTFDARTRKFGDFALSTQGPGGALQITSKGDASQNQLSVRATDVDITAARPFVPWQFPFAGRLNASFDLSGPLFNPDVNGDFRLNDGHVAALEFDTVSGSVTAANGVYHLDHFIMQKGPYRATLSGVVPLRYEKGRFVSTAPIDVTASVTEENLDILSLFVPDMLPSPGQLRAQVSVSGLYPDVAYDGTLTVQNGTVNNKLMTQPLENLNVAMTLKGHRLDIGRFTGTLGKGVVTVTGGADVSGFGLTDMNFRISGQQLSVLAPPYLAALVDADLHYAGSTADPVLQGSISAHNARMTLPLKDLKALAGGGAPARPTTAAERTAAVLHKAESPAASSSGSAEPPQGTGSTAAVVPSPSPAARAPFPLPPITFSVELKLGKDSWLRFLGSTIRVEGDPVLVGKGDAAVPTGKIDLKQGEIQIPLLPVSMRLTKGTAYFDATNGWMPYIDASATTHVGQYDVYMDVRGLANNPDVTLTSSPPLPVASIQQLLLGGAAAVNNQYGAPGSTNTSSSLGLGALVNVAQATFLRPVTGFISQLFGVSEVTFEFQQSGGIQLTLYKGLDAKHKFYLTFSSLQGSNQTSLPRQVYGFEYRFTPQQLVRVSSDNLGGLHFFYQAHWTF